MVGCTITLGVWHCPHIEKHEAHIYKRNGNITYNYCDGKDKK